MGLPTDNTFDVAVMPLVILFVPDPAKGAAGAPLPRLGAAGKDAMQALWTAADLVSVETRQITVRRTYADFEEFWTTIVTGPGVEPQIAVMSAGWSSSSRLYPRRLNDLAVDRESIHVHLEEFLGRVGDHDQAHGIEPGFQFG